MTTGQTSATRSPVRPQGARNDIGLRLTPANRHHAIRRGSLALGAGATQHSGWLSGPGLLGTNWEASLTAGRGRAGVRRCPPPAHAGAAARSCGSRQSHQQDLVRQDRARHPAPYSRRGHRPSRSQRADRDHRDPGPQARRRQAPVLRPSPAQPASCADTISARATPYAESALSTASHISRTGEPSVRG